jgi:hypothetical protein
MQRGNSVLLRSVFSAAIVCAVLRAATFSGADRGGPLPNGKVWETRLIPLRSILTISDEKPNKRVRDRGGRGPGFIGEAVGEARLQSDGGTDKAVGRIQNCAGSLSDAVQEAEAMKSAGLLVASSIKRDTGP